MKQSRQFWRGLFFILLITAFCGGLALPVVSIPARAAPQRQPASHIVISQVYGGGGNNGATFTNDFIELFNRATTAVDLTGWSVQYASATGSGLFSSNVANLSGTINPGQYYLVQLASAGTVGATLPTPDATQTTIDLSATNGKIVLANTTTGLSCNGSSTACAGSNLASIVDLIGYGTANFFEGTSAASAGSNTTANLRKDNGCSDTNNNNVDFVTGTPTPRNTASPASPCTPMSVTNVTSSVGDATYTTADVIDITITFNGQVNVTGLPTLLLETGATDRPATYASGNGTNALLFNYTVTAGDSSADLDYVATNSLSGGTITGATGEAILTLPGPGSPGSLGANKNIVIDTPPSLISFSRQTPSTAATNADILVFRATFSEAVMNVDIADFVATGTTGTLIVTPVSTSVYDIAISAGDLPSLNGTVGLNLNGSQNITDVVGNLLPTIEPSTDQTYSLDNIVPTVTIDQAAGQADPASVPPVNFTVVFSEAIDASTFTPSDITQTGIATGITWTITNPSSDQKTFTLQAATITAAGTLIPSIAAGAVTDLAGNPNTASTSTDNTVNFIGITPLAVLINEVAWAGTGASTADEWIELYNRGTAPINLAGWTLKADDGEPNISLSGTIPAGGYFLLERTDDTTVSDIPADVIYSGELNNSNEIFRLRDPNNNVIDIANSNGGNWPAGSSATFGSMERRGIMPDSDTAWITNTGVVKNGLDANGNAILGTPKQPNWAVSVTPTFSATPTVTRTPTNTRTPTRVPTKFRTATPTNIPPQPLVAINEFVPRPGHDWNNDGAINAGDEYIELLNHGVIDVNLSGYSLDDEVNIGSSPYRLPSVTLKPGERRVFYGSETGLLLSDGGDGVRLLKPNGQLVDAYNYFVVRFPDQSYCRLPDNGGLDDWNENCFPTPGLQNSESASSVNPPTSGETENLCPIADTLPRDFVLAECFPFGNNIWNPEYWDKAGWFDEKYLPENTGKWQVFAD